MLKFPRFLPKTWLLAAFACLHALGISNAFAQGTPPPEPAPIYATGDANGVDLSTGHITMRTTDISVGSGDFPSKLDFTRTFDLNPYATPGGLLDLPYNNYVSLGAYNAHNMLVYFACTNCNNGDASKKMLGVTAVVFGKAYHFQGTQNTGVSPSIQSNDADGSTFKVLNPLASTWTYELITHDGVKVIFSDAAGYAYDKGGGRYAQYVEFPNGDFIKFGYGTSPTTSGGVVRLLQVVNSRGYGLQFTYDNPSSSSNYGVDKSRILTVQAFRTSCVTGVAVNCSTGTLGAVNYTYGNQSFSGTNFVYLFSVTNAAGDQTNYNYGANLLLSTIVVPSISSAPLKTFIYGNYSNDDPPYNYSKLTSVKDFNENITGYSFPDVGETGQPVTVSYPGGGQDIYYTDDYCTNPGCFILMPSRQWGYMPTRHFNPLNALTTYTYDTQRRPVTITRPEGNKITYARDTRANITAITEAAKSGSGLSDLVTSFGYVACSGTNYKYCNKPSYMIDARGARSDYQYDANSGDLAVELKPANANNLRAVIRSTYSGFSYASVGALPSGIIPPQAYYMTIRDTCLTSTVTGTTIDFSYVCAVGNRKRDTFNYTASTDINRTNHELETTVADADTLAATTSYYYDVVGNVISTKLPRTDITGISYTTYDALRRKVYEISPDPDGGAPLPRIVTRHIYNAESNETQTEFGTGTATDGSDFQLIRFQRRQFDPGTSRVLKIESVVP